MGSISQSRHPPPHLKVLPYWWFFYLSRHQPMTLSFRSLLMFCPLSWEYWNGVTTKTRKWLFFVFFFAITLLLLLPFMWILLHFFRSIPAEALLAHLHTLDNHSALYILHSLTPLAQFEECKILELLEQLPGLPRTGGHFHHPQVVSSLVRTKISSEVCFQLKAIYVFSAEEPESPPGPGVQKNIVLFQGFCAMKYAIYALFVNAHKHADCTECEFVQQQQHHQLAEADMDQTSTSLEGCTIGLCFLHFKVIWCIDILYSDRFFGACVFQRAICSSSTIYQSVSCIWRPCLPCSVWSFWKTSFHSSFYPLLTWPSRKTHP